MLLFFLQLLLPLTLTQGVLSANQSLNTAAQQPFDCKHVKAGAYTFDLSTLPAPMMISDSENTPPTTTRTEVRINLCDSLEKDPVAAPDQCPSGTRVCMKITNIKNGDERLTQVIAAGGTEGGDWSWSASLGSHLEGAERELELELHGTTYADRPQQTKIDFKCDRNAAKDSKPTFKKYDKSDGELKLEWITPHACMLGNTGNDNSGKDDSGSGTDSSTSSGGWGFFSWFFFFVFLGGLAYFAIGFWRNYNEYGVIELPNKDFWREAPYIAKDMGKHIYSTVSGQGSNRGAYEPV